MQKTQLAHWLGFSLSERVFEKPFLGLLFQQTILISYNTHNISAGDQRIVRSVSRQVFQATARTSEINQQQNYGTREPEGALAPPPPPISLLLKLCMRCRRSISSYLGFLPSGIGQRHGVTAVATGRHRGAQREAEHALAADPALFDELIDVARAKRSMSLSVVAVEVGHVLHHREDRHLAPSPETPPERERMQVTSTVPQKHSLRKNVLHTEIRP